MVLAQRLLLRWKHSRHKTVTLVTAVTWTLVTVTLLTRQARHVTHIRTAVHDAVDRWHTSDSAVPKLFKEQKWNGYDSSDLYDWLPVSEENEEGGKDAPGALGAAVVLTKEEERLAKAKTSLHQLNLVASDKIPLNRTLPDHRNLQ